jgi:hypothetical protein
VFGLKVDFELVYFGVFEADSNLHEVRNHRFFALLVFSNKTIHSSEVEATVLVVVDVTRDVFDNFLVEILHKEHNGWFFFEGLIVVISIQ